ncbi:hypothetical protein EDB86DRAFT_2812471 [Lactarius hatsudake]|nr:hypothetical protein EDB86DRAFT_2812471 [Lactarius hatsudake]
MELPKYPTEHFLSSHFLICGGSILSESTRTPLRVCLLHHNVRNYECLLPNGRKHRGEDLTVTAERETFEKSYPCERLSLDLITRAPEAGAQTKGGGARSWERGAVHADVATCRGRGGQVHLVVPEVRREDDKVEGTQTVVESFESAFV